MKKGQNGNRNRFKRYILFNLNAGILLGILGFIIAIISVVYKILSEDKFDKYLYVKKNESAVESALITEDLKCIDELVNFYLNKQPIGLGNATYNINANCRGRILDTVNENVLRVRVIRANNSRVTCYSYIGNVHDKLLIRPN